MSYEQYTLQGSLVHLKSSTQAALLSCICPNRPQHAAVEFCPPHSPSSLLIGLSKDGEPLSSSPQYPFAHLHKRVQARAARNGEAHSWQGRR